ncbi:restriction endonuclease [Streptomyces sp. NPDC058667]|uniref:restriction endonuclease n=1 Tax=Streptomyces sp. NPDC058667 TaxID=3346588 RepID=UPI00365A2240
MSGRRTPSRTATSRTATRRRREGGAARCTVGGVTVAEAGRFVACVRSAGRRQPESGDILGLDRLHHRQLEDAVRGLLRRDGAVDAVRVGGAGDNGADVKGTDPAGRRWVVQCEHRRDVRRGCSRHSGPVHHRRHSKLRERSTERLQPGLSQGPAGLARRGASQSDPAQLLRLINTERELVRPSETAASRRTRPTRQRHQDGNKTVMTRVTRERRHPP